MTDGSTADAAVTGHGRRRPGKESTPTASGADTPTPTPRPVKATGLGIRRTGNRPSADAATSVVGIRATGGRSPVTAPGTRPSPDAATSRIGIHVTGGPPNDAPPADATGLGHRVPAGPTPGPTRADATGLGHRLPSPPPPVRGGAPGPGARRHDPAGRAGPHDVVRFGPGMAPPAPASPTWQRPPTEAPATTARRPRKRRTPVVSGLVTLLAVAAVVAYLLSRTVTPVGVQAVSVAAVPAQAGCDTPVALVGTVTTDGPAGTFTYRWERSDGQIGEVLSQSVASGATSTEVRLQWTVSGQGSFDGSATLRVLDGVPVTPEAAVGTGGFTYACD